MNVHIGNIIETIVRTKGLSVITFANQINCSPRNVYEIFKKKHIDTELLVLISEKLDENLFARYLTDVDMMHYQHQKFSEEFLNKIAGKKELPFMYDMHYKTQDPLTLKLMEMISELQRGK